jgi:peptidoglycan/xylan/chitin deacetylase (PgdA/CDA1 family)
MNADGFEVCTHTYSHYKLTDRPEDWVADDIRKGLDVIQEVTGKRYPYMRPPGGFYDDNVIQAAAENGCYLVLWTSEFGDTNSNVTADQEVKAVLSNLCNGDIILCHFGGTHTYDALKRLIPEIRGRGYEFVTLSQLISD